VLDGLNGLLRRFRRRRDGSAARLEGDRRADAMVVGENLGAELNNPDAPAGAPVNWVRPVDEGRPRK
jgi:hypothetical protein